ncbi:MAG: ATP-binding protein [Thermodesulfobacteriota bacterium]
MVEKSVSFVIEAVSSALEMLQVRVEEAAEQWQLSPKTTFQINLALDELVTNIINHGHGGDSGDHFIDIQMRMDGSKLTIVLFDDGPPFDLTSAADPNLDAALDERPVGGLGIFLVRQYMDKVEYKFQEGKNSIILVKYCSEREESEK